MAASGIDLWEIHFVICLWFAGLISRFYKTAVVRFFFFCISSFFFLCVWKDHLSASSIFKGSNVKPKSQVSFERKGTPCKIFSLLQKCSSLSNQSQVPVNCSPVFNKGHCIKLEKMQIARVSSLVECLWVTFSTAGKQVGPSSRKMSFGNQSK